MRNNYQKLLDIILDPDSPDPTVVVYNERHLASLRAGLSRAKKVAQTLRAFTNEENLDNYIFKYTPASDRPHLITISLVPAPQGFEIVLVDDRGKPNDSPSEQILNDVAGFETGP